MQEHDYATPADDGAPHGVFGAPDRTSERDQQQMPVTKVGPRAHEPAKQHQGALSSPVTWLSLATLLAAVIAYLLLAPIPAATQTATDQAVPTQR